MPYRKWFHRFCLVVTGLFLFAGCGRAEPPLPTLTGGPALPVAATLANPTLAQPLPTATLLPPTATTAPLTPTPWPQVIVPGPNDVHALLVLPDGLGPNWYLNADNFESYGWILTLAGTHAAIQPCPSAAGWYGLPSVEVDVILDEHLDLSQFQVVAVMPATKKVADAYGDLLGSPAALSLLAAADQAGTALYASCGGVRVLAAADVLDGHQVTGEALFMEEYAAAGAIYVGGGNPPRH